MSSNGAVGCPEDMQVESALEGSLKHRDAVINKQSNLSNSIADTNGKHLFRLNDCISRLIKTDSFQVTYAYKIYLGFLQIQRLHPVRLQIPKQRKVNSLASKNGMQLLCGVGM